MSSTPDRLPERTDHRMNTPAQPATPTFVAWGRTRGSMVVNTRRHLTVDRVNTLCGVLIPAAALRPSDRGTGALRQVWPMDADEIMREPACRACARAAAR